MLSVIRAIRVFINSCSFSLYDSNSEQALVKIRENPPEFVTL